MSVFSQKFRKTIKKAASWSLAALTALSCASTIPVLTSKTVNAEAYTVDLSNEARGVLYASSRSDFRDESIYFLITTRFYDGDTSNNYRSSEDDKAQNPESDPSWRGDFKGLIDKLDYIRALGFTAIWITPVVQNRSGYDYHGYHAYDFTAVDTRYESNGITYQDLINACHAKGMKVIQDVVFNHSCNWGEKNLCPIEIDTWSPGRSTMPMPAGESMDPNKIYHHFGWAGGGDWDNYNVQITTLADDCFDLNTENPTVYNYLIDCYKSFVDMGVDAFRVDTVKHMSRLTLNKTLIPALREEYRKVHSGSGYEDFYMFGEVCTKGESVWYRDQPPISTCFYTWADDDSWLSKWTSDPDANVALTEEHYNAHSSTSNQPTSTNAFLKGNDYHTPDYSQRSGLDSIDFQMHWQFDSAGAAFGMAQAEDPYFNDSTWNVTYINSHDYSPNNTQTIIPNFSAETWAEDLSLIFTFRGIPCIYYGTEIQFQAGKVIDKGPNCPLSETGRAYFGDNIEGTLSTTAPGVFDATDGTVKDTLESPLSQHLIRLNRIRQAVPALRKGQYSTEGISGNGMAFKRRYTDDKVDSFCCVTISGGATFSGIPNGTYVDAVTGDTQNVTGGTLTANCSGQGNLRVYVLSTAKTPAPGRVVPNGSFMGDGGSAVIINHESVNTVKPTGIKLDKTEVTILEEETTKVTATISPKDASATVSWSTSDPSVATVAGGTIKGVSAGTAIITAKVSDTLSAAVTVTVKTNTSIVKPTGVTITPSTLTLTAGDTGSLTATVTPSNATDKSVTWTSSDANVAKVDASGNITAVKAGSATITAATSNGLKATASITVEGKTVTLKYVENGVYFEKPSGWGSNLNAYIYDPANGNAANAQWPGEKMSEAAEGVYVLEMTSPASTTSKVIFNDGNNQVPGSGATGFDFKNRGYYTINGYDHTVEKVETVDVTSVTVSPSSATVAVGGTTTLSATVAPSNATNKTITWSSSDNSIATVSGGVVTGKAAGTATITAKSNNGKTATATVTVTGGDDEELDAAFSVSPSTINTGEKATFSASASGGKAPYQYALYYKKSTESSYSTFKDYSTSSSFSFTTQTEGTYNFKLKVKDSAGTVVSKTANLVVKSDALQLTNKCTVSSTSITLGKTVTVTGAAAGGTTPYKYAVYYKKASSSSYTKVQDFSTTKTISVTLSAATKYNIRTKVKDGSGKIVTKDFTITVNPGVLANKSTISATSITLGKSVTITGAATGGTSPYKYAAYYKKSSASSYTLARDYSTTSTISFKPAAATTYNIRVKVKDSLGTVVSKDFNLTVKQSTLANTTKLSATSIALGKSVTITGAATGGTSPYQYSAYYKKSGTSNFSQIRAFSTTATMTFKPSSATSYVIRTKVKDKTGKIVTKDITLKVTNAALANTSKLSATSVTKGSKVTITGAATGGTSPYQYSAYYKKASTSSYTQIRDFSTTATMSFTPSAVTTYDVRVKVKDKTGKVVNKDFTLKVTAAGLTNKSTLSATSITLGKSITITGAATGGTSPYQYSAYYKKASTSSYTQISGFTTNTKMTFKPAAATTYDVRVKVKDKAGKIVSKDFTVKVTK